MYLCVIYYLNDGKEKSREGASSIDDLNVFFFLNYYYYFLFFLFFRQETFIVNRLMKPLNLFITLIMFCSFIYSSIHSSLNLLARSHIFFSFSFFAFFPHLSSFLNFVADFCLTISRPYFHNLLLIFFLLIIYFLFFVFFFFLIFFFSFGLLCSGS